MQRNSMETEIEELDLGPRTKVARTFAERLIKQARITSAPVSLQRVIEHVQSSRNVSIIKDPSMPQKISGLLVRTIGIDDEYVTIGVNGHQPWCRRRFTLGHELGHLLLEHQGCSGSPNDGSHEEQEANAFAAELLMPRVILKADLRKQPNIPELAKLYCVSSQALTIHLIKRRLL